MTPFDVRLIDPALAELVAAALSATRAANEGWGRHRLDKDEPAWARSLGRIFRTPAGQQAWPGDDDVVAGTPHVRVTWWTDRLGRKHWRVRGERKPLPISRNWPPARHDLWHVYPDRLLWRAAGGGEGLVAVCGCGAAGPPEVIGWTGPRCGPCHDRLVDGQLPAERPFRIDRRGHEDYVGHVCYLPGGRLVTGGDDGRIVWWEADGASRVLLDRPGTAVQALAASAVGLVAACTAPERRHLLLLDVSGNGGWRTVGLPGDGVALALSPDGTRLLATLSDQSYLLEMRGREQAVRPVSEARAVRGRRSRRTARRCMVTSRARRWSAWRWRPGR